MSRKDYVLIAAALKEARSADETNSAAIAMHNHTTRVIARELGLDNPRFDMPRFLAAAGVL